MLGAVFGITTCTQLLGTLAATFIWMSHLVIVLILLRRGLIRSQEVLLVLLPRFSIQLLVMRSVLLLYCYSAILRRSQGLHKGVWLLLEVLSAILTLSRMFSH